MENIERRTLDLYDNGAHELRIERSHADSAPRLAGYAIRFNSLSKDLGGFRERIMPSAVDKTLADGVDVRALVDHDLSKLPGRTSAGTLKIGKDDRGLWFNVDLPDTQYSRDLQILVERRDVRGMSFGFIVPKGGDSFTRINGEVVRDVNGMDLREITVTSVPAYGDTSVSLRIDPAIASRFPSRQTWILETARRRLEALKAMYQ